MRTISRGQAQIIEAEEEDNFRILKITYNITTYT